MCLTKERKATFGKTLAIVGKISNTPCIVAIAPIIQKVIIGRVKGVLNVIFFLNKRKIHERSTKKTTKSSPLTYTQVFFTSNRGILGKRGIKIRRNNVSKNKIFSQIQEKIFFIKLYLNHAALPSLYVGFLFARSPISFAGTPPTILNSSTSFVTTAPAPTTAPFLTVTPGRIIALGPIKT